MTEGQRVDVFAQLCLCVRVFVSEMEMFHQKGSLSLNQIFCIGKKILDCQGCNLIFLNELSLRKESKP